jgi:hypothetical protein
LLPADRKLAFTLAATPLLFHQHIENGKDWFDRAGDVLPAGGGTCTDSKLQLR